MRLPPNFDTLMCNKSVFWLSLWFFQGALQPHMPIQTTSYVEKMGKNESAQVLSFCQNEPVEKPSERNHVLVGKKESFS